MAYPRLDKISFNDLNKYAIPVQGFENGLGIPFFDSNRNLDELKNRLCDGNPLTCRPSEGANDNSNNNQLNGDRSDKLDKKMERLKEKLDNSIFNHDKNDQSQSEDTQLNPEVQEDDKQRNNNNDDDNQDDNKKDDINQGNNNDDNHKQLNNNDNNNQGNNNDDDNEIETNGLNLNFENKQDKINDRIEKFKDKISKENNGILLKQQENKKITNDKNDDNNDQGLYISASDLKIQKIQANLEKKIEKLKDKIENDKDNQRLIDHRQDNEAKDNDDEDNDDTKKGDGESYDGYRFNGDNDNGNDGNNFNFAAAGDFGCSTNTQNTVSNMERKDPELVLALGDLSYHSTADCWFDMMSPLKGKMMITLGYHDINDGAGKMNQYVKSFELNKPYYSYDYKHVHFLVMASLSDYKEGSEQYNFIKQDLEKASQNEDTNWVIVSTYKPLYSSPSEHPADDSLRDAYSPLFEKYGVDLVLNGHNHNYQRTYPLTYNPNESAKPITTSEVSTGYNRGNDGIVFATVGTGGVNFYSLEGKNPYVANQFAGKFGFLNINISNGSPHAKLTGTFYDNKGSEITDEFTIEKEIKNKKSDVSYS
ncbi:MAG TPA: metallophosphoesterase [Nitrososphaeraceae archaeon]|nr:metallophosphoesterase [Nitrososphaeraceae archaeon]